MKNMKYQRLQLYFFIAVFLIVLTLATLVFRPYFGVLLLAATFAVIFSPIHGKIRDFLMKFLKWRKGEIARIISALLTLIIFLVILLGPLTFLGIQLVDEVKGLHKSISTTENLAAINRVLNYTKDQVGLYLPNFSIDISSYLQKILQWFAQNINIFFQSIGSFLLGSLLTLLASYYLLKDGHRLKEYFIKVSPLPDGDDKKIFEKMKTAVNSIIRGSLAIAIIQGFLTGIGFAIFGIPSPTLWGSFAAITALIPTVGTSLILIPGIAYLLLTGKLLAGLGLLIWGVVAVGLIDNLLGPHLMKRGVPIHPFLILLGVLGGLSFFGVVGFLVGPLIISLLYALLDIYTDIIKPAKAK